MLQRQYEGKPLYLKYQVMLSDGRQTYDHVYASSDSSSNYLLIVGSPASV